MEDNKQEGNAFWDIAKIGYSWSTLEALEKTQTHGFYLPWSKGMGNIADSASNRIVGGNWNLARGLRMTNPTKNVVSSAAPVMAKGPFKTIPGGLPKLATTGLPYRALASGMGRTALTFMRARFAFMGAELMWGAWKGFSDNTYAQRGLETGGYFPDARMGVTSRQRAARAISESHLQARSAIGGEAMLLHR